MPKSQACPIIKPTRLLGDTWTLLIINAFFDGATRFNALAEAIPSITRSMLSQRLKMLVMQGLVVRVESGKGQAQITYTLTQKGRGLKPVIVAIEEYGNRYLVEG